MANNRAPDPKAFSPPLTPEELSFRKAVGTRRYAEWAEQVRAEWEKKRLDSGTLTVQGERRRKA